MNINSLTVSYTGKVSAIVSPVEISNPLHNGGCISTQAIWDTGATNSVITLSSAKRLGLVPITRTPVNGVHGTQDANVYFVHVVLNNKQISLKLRVTECAELSSDLSIGMLIGMDVISLGDFAVTNFHGKTTMTFRVPSSQEIDFVKASQMANPQISKDKKIGRNDLCPCGSGLKFKNCCGRNKVR